MYIITPSIDCVFFHIWVYLVSYCEEILESDSAAGKPSTIISKPAKKNQDKGGTDKCSKAGTEVSNICTLYACHVQ